MVGSSLFPDHDPIDGAFSADVSEKILELSIALHSGGEGGRRRIELIFLLAGRMKTDAGLGWLKSIFKVAREPFDGEVKNFFKISFHAVDYATELSTNFHKTFIK